LSSVIWVMFVSTRSGVPSRIRSPMGSPYQHAAPPGLAPGAAARRGSAAPCGPTRRRTLQLQQGRHLARHNPSRQAGRGRRFGRGPRQGRGTACAPFAAAGERRTCGAAAERRGVKTCAEIANFHGHPPSAG
jgi:hypothetical protein